MNADRVTVANLCVQLFDRLQQHYARKEEQVLALACAFAIITDALRDSPQDAFTAARALMFDRTHPDRKEHRFAAVEDHVRNELGVASL